MGAPTAEPPPIDPMNGGKAVIENGHLVVRVAIDALPSIVEGSWAAGILWSRHKVTDPGAFANELLAALNEESEDGTTRVHQMFDGAIISAIEQGAEGIEEHEEQDV